MADEIVEVGSMPVDPPSFDRGALESETTSKMSDIFKDADDVVEEAAPVTQEGIDKPATETEETKQEETPAPAEKPAPKAPVTPTPEAAAIPAAYRRSLKAYQWSDEEIDAAAKANPAGFLKTAEKMHMSRVEETRRWAEIGKKASSTDKPAEEPKKPVFAPIDVEALRKKYGNEAFIDELAKQNAALAYLQDQVMPFMQASQDRQRASEIASLTKTVDEYFGSKEMEPYHDHYGKSGQTLNDKQLAERQKVLETANLLIGGARSMGRPMTLDEALTMAHDSVASPIAAKVAVKKVETQVRARQQQISLRPGSRAAAGRAAARKGLEKSVAGGLAAVFQ